MTLCGQLVPITAEAPEEVTCKICLKKIAKARPDTSANEYVEDVLHRREPIEFAPPPSLVDPLSDLPFVSPFTWTTLKDRHHWCASCPTCSWFNKLEAEAAAAPWKKKHFSGERTRWSSVNAALRWYVELRGNGFSVGTIGEALVRIGKLGAIIRGSGQGSAAIEEADDAHTIETSLASCYQSISRRGLSRDERLFALFSVAIGEKPHEVARKLRERSELVENLTGPMVSAIAVDGRWTIYQSLRERKLVPER